MKISKTGIITSISLIVVTMSALFFQNCAKSKYFDPDPVHSAFAKGLMQNCSDSSGLGTATRQDQASAFSSCNYESCYPGFELIDHACIAIICAADSVASCEVVHGEGRMTCFSTGQGYGNCTAIGCESGFSLSDGQCKKDEDFCAVGARHDCGTQSTYGSQICNELGTAYSECQFSECKPGYNKLKPEALVNNEKLQKAVSIDGGLCVPNICEPLTSGPCSVGVGIGNQTCSSQGNSWGACAISSCQTGYFLKDGNCQVNICEAGATHDCGTQSTFATEICLEEGSGYGECKLGDCKAGFNKSESGVCVANACTANSSSPCTVGQGTGTQLCNSQGSNWGSCAITDCASGFVLREGVCVATVCRAGSHRDCSTHSTEGSQICTNDGSGYAECKYNGCKNGYNNDPNNQALQDENNDNKLDGGKCFANTCEPKTLTPCQFGNGKGFKSCNSQGSSWGACELNECQSGYTLDKGVCLQMKCSPGIFTYCEFSNGSGLKTCNRDGMNYSSCVLDDCNKGFTPLNGKCIEQICQPNAKADCHGQSGTGEMICNENGLGYNSCKLIKCDSGFKLKDGECVTKDSCDNNQSETCSIENGSGERACNSESKKLGPCIANNCNNGYTLTTFFDSKVCQKNKKNEK